MKAETIARREQLKARADNLRRARGAAMLEGKPFDDAKIRSVQSEIDALDDAEREATRRDAEEAVAAAAARRKEAKARLVERENDRVAAVGAFEVAARQMAENLHKVLALSAEVGKAAMDVGSRRPWDLEPAAVEKRLSSYLASILAKPPIWSLGIIEWSSLMPQPKDWTEAERAIMALHIAECIAG